MADIYAVKFNNSGTVTIPNCSLSGTYTLKLRFKTHTTLTTDALIGSSAEAGGSPTNFVAVYTAGEMKIRLNGTVVYTSAQALFQANKKYSITVTVTSGTASITAVNETDSTTIINAASATMSTAFTFDRIGGGGASSALALTGEIAEVETTNSSDNRRYISTVNTGSVWSETVGGKNGTLNGLPTDGTQWVFYETAAVDPAPTGEVTLGTPTDVTSSSATLPYFYSENDQTGFEYRLNGGSVFTVTSSPLLLTGLTASTSYSVEVRAVNGTTTGAWSAPANFTTSAATAAISFSGTIPAQVFTAGQAVSVNLAPYFSGTLTPFTFANTGALLTGTGLSITSAGLLTGTATTGTATGIIVTGTDASLNTATSNAFNVTVNAASVPVSFGGTIPAITGTQNAAMTPVNTSTYFTGSLTPFSYSLFSGTLPTGVTLNSSTGVISGTPTVSFSGNIVVRATDTGSNTANSNSIAVNIAAPVGTITITGVANNIDTPWISSAVDAATIMPPSLGSVVVNKTGLSTTAGAVLVITDAAIVTGTEYITILKIGTAYGWYRAVAT